MSAGRYFTTMPWGWDMLSVASRGSSHPALCGSAEPWRAGCCRKAGGREVPLGLLTSRADWQCTCSGSGLGATCLLSKCKR